MKESLRRYRNVKVARGRYKVWFRQAEFDLMAANISLEKRYYEWATYQAEQAVEKSLKAVLVHAGWRPPRVHRLQVLMGICNRVNPEFKETKFNFKHIESFTFISRYPFLIPGKNSTPHELIFHKDAEEAVNQAKEFLKQIAKILKHPHKKDVSEKKILESYSEQEIKERIAEVVERLVREFDPEKIMIFGSFARDGQKMKSGTMDVLIIAQTKYSFIERIQKARAATQGGMPIIEPLVYTPKEFKIMTEEEGESFFESALEEGIEIYKKK